VRHLLEVAAALLLTLSCVNRGVTVTSNGALGTAAQPVRPPGPGISGCVESRELKDYVQTLEAHRRAARSTALAALGVRGEERRGVFASAGTAHALGETRTASGQRFGVVAYVAPPLEPRALLAKRGSSLHRIDERARAHPVPVLVCGTQACRAPSQGRTQPVPSAPARPVLVPLEPGEALGEALQVSYDFWWAQVSYDRKAECPTP
jgi:hypothetical protein